MKTKITKSGNMLVEINGNSAYFNKEITECYRTVSSKEWKFAESWDTQSQEKEISKKEIERILDLMRKYNSDNDISWTVFINDDIGGDVLFEGNLYSDALDYIKDNSIEECSHVKFTKTGSGNSWLDEFEHQCKICGTIVEASFTDCQRDLIEYYCSNCKEYKFEANY